MSESGERRIVGRMVRCGKEFKKYKQKGHPPCCGESNLWMLRILK